jgi:hypothetical protein
VFFEWWGKQQQAGWDRAGSLVRGGELKP